MQSDYPSVTVKSNVPSSTPPLNVKLGFVQPEKSTQNAFIESLKGKFRNQCLNQQWFKSLEEARSEIDQWREHYNNVRPHSSLGYTTG